ncbi:FecR family protein [Mucilaginibacter sp. FT3.2]|uniref:FecR family protein n=1 Tax=Mucilaginibacter sp. FT3.2 TaxID=2723090 RepID=UPI00161417E6|nr:FecR family protein [Mucilaginibacter sp. FT3.2]MBB6234416.1 hypothetical protein [Mucilaginibacter sp. FT3.2]
MTPEEYILLYEKFVSGHCTPGEEKQLMEYQDAFDLQEDVHNIRLSKTDQVLRRSLYSRINQSVSNSKTRHLNSSWWWAAAVLLLSTGIGIVFFKQNKAQTIVNNKVGQNLHKPILPGKNTAILTLSNGTNIVLDDAKNGVLAKSGKAEIKKLKNGLIAYTDDDTKANEAALNTITIPRGGQYAVMLPDGTNVWLNSQSSLTYPVAFNGAERNVTLKGEAYFEVAKNKQHPFIVHTYGVSVKVLGTHFNVSAYNDDNEVKTTLLEGSVSLTKGHSSALLIPGQQGIASSQQDKIITKTVNVNQAVAWKMGYFIFRDDNIGDIMKKVARWYDVEVEYKGTPPTKTFGGTYAKGKDINELLNGLELTGLIHFKIEGRRIIVMN